MKAKTGSSELITRKRIKRRKKRRGKKRARENYRKIKWPEGKRRKS